MNDKIAAAKLLYTEALIEFNTIKTREVYSKVLELGRNYYSFITSTDIELKIYYDIVSQQAAQIRRTRHRR